VSPPTAPLMAAHPTNPDDLHASALDIVVLRHRIFVSKTQRKNRPKS
jgi:hypothetical protein